MSLLKEKAIHLLLTLGLLVSVFVPSIAMAYETKGEVSNPSLTIHKFEQEPGTKEGEEGTGLPGQNAEGKAVEGVTFTLTMTHKYDAQADTWTEVTDGKTIEAITNDKGQAVFTKDNGLELGRYKVQETKGPAHVILNKDAFSVDVPMTSKEGTELNYDVHVYPKNETVRGAVELIKEDEDGKELSGVTFGLFNEDGTKAVDTEGKEIPTLTTGEKGKISVEGLAAGKYYFQELSTLPGLALNDSKLAFEVTKDASGQEVEVNWTAQDKYLTEDGKVTNYKLPDLKKDVEEKNHHEVDRDTEFNYNLTIKAPKDIEKYALLAVTDTLDDRLEYADKWSVIGTDASNIEFKQEGQKLVWSVKDLSLLTPGQDVKITFVAKIKKDAVLEPNETGIPNTAELDFNNNHGSFTKPVRPEDPTEPPYDPPKPPVVTVDPKDGGLKVIKVDKKDHEIKLENAEFKLTTDAEGKNVVDAKGTVIKVNGASVEGKLEGLLTGKNGEINITGLTPGTYYLHETKAPTFTNDKGEVKPYRLLTKPLEVVVQNKVNDKEVVVENSQSGWDLPKTGGLGTILFTVSGTLFMLVGFVLLARKDRKQA